MRRYIAIFIVICAFMMLFLSAAYSEDRSVTVKGKKGTDTAVSISAHYYALIIGNNNYKHLPKLKTAVNDAKAVEKILKNQYGFETKLLIDAPRKDILSAINDFRKKLSSKDSLLIYYAGHGEYDKTADRAYWLPVDAQRDDPVDWISATDITDNIKRIASRHILIVSDSCYSGTLTRAAAGDLLTKGSRDEFIKKMLERPSRTLMASGGNEPVTDSGDADHSVFASAFLKALREMDKGAFTAEELFHGRVKSIVAGKSEQVPEYNDIRNSGHEGGDFVFQLASIAPTATKEDTGFQAPKPSAEISEEMKKLKEEKERLKSEREELDQKKALMEEKKSLEQERQKLEKEKTEIAMAPRKVWEAITGKTYKEPTTGMEFILVKGGCYQMGNTDGGFFSGESDEKPVHEVCVDDFYIGKYEVTQGQWKEVMKKNPSYFKDCGDNCPVEQVSWHDANEFISKLNKKAGNEIYRLPTEAEWEYAAKGSGKNEKWAGTSNESELGDYGWYKSNSGGKTHPVGQKKPNDFGLYDMSGNVMEWVQDGYYHKAYVAHEKNNPIYKLGDFYVYDARSAGSGRTTAPTTCVLRGGNWNDKQHYIRTSVRFNELPSDTDKTYGFRLVLPAK